MRFQSSAAFVPLLVLALAGCNKSPSVDAKNSSVADVAKQVGASGFKFTPGEWQTTAQIDSFDIGRELPPEAAAAMKSMTGKPRTFNACLTPEQAAKPGPEFFGEQQKGCTYEHFSMADGKLDAKLVCKPDGGGRGVTMTMSGNFTATGYDLAMASNGDGGGNPVSMKMKVSGKRLGECTGKAPG